MADPSENGGGWGSEYLDPRKLARLERQALRGKWVSTPEERRALIKRQIDIAINAIENRESTQAARAVISAEGQNLAAELKATPGVEIHAHAVFGIEELRACILAGIGGERERRKQALGDSNGSGNPPGDNSPS